MKQMILESISFSKLSLTTMLVFISAFLAPIKDAMIAVSVLIAIDFVFGIIAACKVKEAITSKKMSRTAIKLFVYQFLLISAHLCEQYLLSWIPFVQITLGFFALVEFLSIGESFSKITGQNFLTYVKGILMSKFKEKMPDQNFPENKP
jgi:phage-related holin